LFGSILIGEVINIRSDLNEEGSRGIEVLEVFLAVDYNFIGIGFVESSSS
jgi:hypothetical protein